MPPIAVPLLIIAAALGTMLFALWYVKTAVDEGRSGWVDSKEKDDREDK